MPNKNKQDIRPLWSAKSKAHSKNFCGESERQNSFRIQRSLQIRSKIQTKFWAKFWWFIKKEEARDLVIPSSKKNWLFEFLQVCTVQTILWFHGCSIRYLALMTWLDVHLQNVPRQKVRASECSKCETSQNIRSQPQNVPTTKRLNYKTTKPRNILAT